MNITDKVYYDLLRENKELKAQRDQLRSALQFYVSICGNTANNVCKETAAEMHATGSAALAATKEAS